MSRGTASWVPSRASLLTTAAVAGVFVLVVGGVLLENHRRSRAAVFVNSTKISQLKEELRKSPMDEAVKERLRALDLEVRQEYFRRKVVSRRGNWLLVGGLVVMLTAIGAAGGLSRPEVPPRSPSRPGNAGRSRWTVAAVGVIVLGIAWGLAPRELVLPEVETPDVPAPAPAGPPTAAELAANWPRFRGAGGDGLAPDRQPPLTWDLASRKNVKWRVAVPLPGQGSPLVWGDRVFLTGATASLRQVFCFGADDGRLRWQATVRATPTEQLKEIYKDTGFAPSTGVVDGRRVVVMFANGDLAAFDLDGGALWARNLGLPDNLYGHAASLELAGDRVIVQLDQGYGGDGLSRLMAVDGATGETVWEVKRDAPGTWATPLLIEAPSGPQIVCCGNPFVSAYSPATGEAVWKAELLYGEVVPSPIFVDGVVYVANASAVVAAIRPDGTGDVTESGVIWKAEDGLPDIVSPWCDGKRLLLMADGLVTCYAAADGRKLWEHDFETQVWASPTLAGDHLMVPAQEGVMIVFTIDDTGLQETARLPLGGACTSSPAFVGRRIYVRTERDLLCLEGSE